MNTKDYREFVNKSSDGSLSDDDNPVFVFSLQKNTMLAYLMNPDVDVKKMVARELVQRGLNFQGMYVGFANAKEEFLKVYGEEAY